MTKGEKVLSAKTTQVEIVAHKNATKREAKKVNDANKRLNELFEDNHFTVKLVLAAKG